MLYNMLVWTNVISDELTRDEHAQTSAPFAAHAHLTGLPLPPPVDHICDL